VFDMLMVILLCFSLKVADVSLSESGHLVPWWLTSHTGLITPIDRRVHSGADQNFRTALRSYPAEVIATHYRVSGIHRPGGDLALPRHCHRYRSGHDAHLFIPEETVLTRQRARKAHSKGTLSELRCKT